MNPSIVRFRTDRPYPLSLAPLCWSLSLVLAIGCAEDTSIRKYHVAKKEAQRTTAPAISSANVSSKEQRMLAAIVPHQDVAWFFKLTGDPEIVLENDPEFRNIVKSVAFNGSGEPNWKLSDGWQQQITPNDITYGKLTNSETGLTATVTRLPFTSSATEDNWRRYIVVNINRWRKQLSLEQQEWEQMSSELEEFPELSQGPAKAYYVSITGKGSGSMSAPFMNRTTNSNSATPPSATSPSAGNSDTSVPHNTSPPTASAPTSPAAKPIAYRVPAGWSEMEASGMRMAAFSIAAEDASAEVTVIAAGGGIDANIGIWLGQVGAEANAEHTANIVQAAEAIAVNGVDAKLYTINGRTSGNDQVVNNDVGTINDEEPANAKENAAALAKSGEAEDASTAPQTILIADIPWREGQSLFVKYKGPQSLAQMQREAFIEFVKSIEWH